MWCDGRKDGFQRYLDAGIAFTNLTRAKAEELVHELVKSGEFQSADARAKVDELLERSRKGREAFVAQVRHEVARQLESGGHHQPRGPGPAGGDPDRPHGRCRQAAAAAKAAKKAPAKKAAAKKAPGQEGSGEQEGGGEEGGGRRRLPAKKAAAKKAPAKKAAAKKAPARSRPAPGSAGLTQLPAASSRPGARGAGAG